jgi:GntR family transcriptional regulator, transcriptional repressor for pyruvate dehydrogenase complex
MEIGQMRGAIPESKGRTIAEHRAIAHGLASGDMDAVGAAIRVHFVAAGQSLRTVLPSQETQG